MTLRSRLATSPARTVPVAKVFGPGVPPQIEAAEARAQMTPGSPFGPGTPIGPYDPAADSRAGVIRDAQGPDGLL
jgi:hypothetical protein